MNTSSLPPVPRIESLHHRLLNAKTSTGEPTELLDELMIFLEDPPPETGDRWQAGADFCSGHGIETSRMAVWRFYRAHVVQWRRANATPVTEVAPETTKLLLNQGRHLVAVRALESLHDPRLSPAALVGLIQGENRRQQIQLARDKFNEQLETKRTLDHRERVRQINQAAHDKAMIPYLTDPNRLLIEKLAKIYAASENAPKLYPHPRPVSDDNTL